MWVERERERERETCTEKMAKGAVKAVATANE